LLTARGKFFLIFFSKPSWYVNFWASPFAGGLFRSYGVRDEEIRKFKNIKIKHSFSANITTTIEIDK